MLQVRKLVLAVAAATSMASGMAHALGLGEISVKSALNEPLVAEIELLETKGLTADEIRSRLASAEDFTRAGVERQFFLNSLKFTPVIRPVGKSFVRVTSSQPVREPFLNFLMEVYWPAGRMMKEYTLLLDPPLYAPEQVVYESGASVAERPEAARPTPLKTTNQPKARPTVTAKPAARLEGDSYRVEKNDTLWEIALRVRRGGSVHQTMLAIQDLNPTAFIDGNPNRIKSGYALKLPDAGQIQERSRGEAVAEFLQRSENLRSVGTAERQLDARRRETAAAAPARIEEADSLRLVAADSGESATASDSGQASRELSDQLALTQEKLDSSRRENLELTERVDSLSGQVEKLQRLLELKNTQLANLQDMAAEEQLAAAALEQPDDLQQVAEVLTEVAEPSGLNAAGEQQEQQDAEQIASQSLVDDSTTGIEQTADESESASLAEQESDLVAESVPEKVAEPVKAEPEKKPAPIKQPQPEPVAQGSFLDDLMANPLFLPGVGGGAAVLLLLGLLGRRKKAKQSEEAEVLPPEETSDVIAGQTSEADEIDLGELDSLADLDSQGPDLSTLDDMIEEPAGFADMDGESASDPIAEAEDYISFGRFNQAAEVLLKAVDANPQRQDLRFKLLEVYADLEDRKSFLEQVDELNAMGVAQAEIDALHERFPHLMGEDDGLSLDDIILDLPDMEEPEQAVEAVQPAELDDLSSVGLSDGDLSNLDDLLSDDLLDSLMDDGQAQAEPAAEISQPVQEEAAEEIDEFDSLLSEVEAELESELDLDAALELDSDLAADDTSLDAALGFELEPLSDLTEREPVTGKAVFDVPDMESLESEAEDLESASDEDDFSLEDLQLDDLGLEPVADTVALDDVVETVETAQADELDLDFDLSVPLDEGDASEEEAGFSLDDLNLESELESLGDSFDELREEIQDVIQDDSVGLDLEAELDALTVAPGEAMPSLDADSVALDLDEVDFELPEEPGIPEAASSADDMLAELEQSLGEDFDFLQGDDEDQTKLDLATAWIEMGDIEGARDILDEVMREGTPEHQEMAKELLAKIG